MDPRELCTGRRNAGSVAFKPRNDGADRELVVAGLVYALAPADRCSNVRSSICTIFSTEASSIRIVTSSANKIRASVSRSSYGQINALAMNKICVNI